MVSFALHVFPPILRTFTHFFKGFLVYCEFYGFPWVSRLYHCLFFLMLVLLVTFTHFADIFPEFCIVFYLNETLCNNSLQNWIGGFLQNGRRFVLMILSLVKKSRRECVKIFHVTCIYLQMKIFNSPRSLFVFANRKQSEGSILKTTQKRSEKKLERTHKINRCTCNGALQLGLHSFGKS